MAPHVSGMSAATASTSPITAMSTLRPAESGAPRWPRRRACRVRRSCAPPRPTLDGAGIQPAVEPACVLRSDRRHAARARRAARHRAGGGPPPRDPVPRHRRARGDALRGTRGVDRVLAVRRVRRRRGIRLARRGDRLRLERRRRPRCATASRSTRPCRRSTPTASRAVLAPIPRMPHGEGQGRASPTRRWPQDVARVRAVREALGPEGRIRVDANGGWNVDEAEHAIHALAPFDLEYVEQPCATRRRARRDRAAASKYMGIPIAADESVRRAEDPLAVAEAGAADLLVIKAQPLGGIRRALELIGRRACPSSSRAPSTRAWAWRWARTSRHPCPTLDFDCGLGTASLLAADVTRVAAAARRRRRSRCAGCCPDPDAARAVRRRRPSAPTGGSSASAAATPCSRRRSPDDRGHDRRGDQAAARSNDA